LFVSNGLPRFSFRMNRKPDPGHRKLRAGLAAGSEKQ
jgi:hypothetical protein